MSAPRRKPADLNRRAAAVVAEATGTASPEPKKNPHAVALGKLGGQARKRQMSPERRREIARQANTERQRRFRARQKERVGEAAQAG
jgi:hypothetical protein